MTDETNAVDVSVLSEMVSALNKLDAEARTRMLQSLATLYGVSPVPGPTASATPQHWMSSVEVRPSEVRPSFTEDRSVTVKEFVWQKQPKTAVERVVCLGYYLAHYRGMQHFKTSDISALNMEAAQLKFSNPAMAVAEAVRAGFLASAGGQKKQLTIIGEQFVRLLPDRQAANDAVRSYKPKRPRRKPVSPSEEEKAE